MTEIDLVPAIHGKGVVLAVDPSGVGVAVIAYSKASGFVGGVLETYFLAAGEPGENLEGLLRQGDWILAHGARAAKALLTDLSPEVARRPWVCSQGILEGSPAKTAELASLLWDAGLVREPLMPGPLALALGLVNLIGRGDPTNLAKALHRAGNTHSQTA